MGARIEAVRGRRVWDSRGKPTVEAEILLQGGQFGRAIAPAGASMGANEAVDRRDGGTAHGGADVRAAVESINGEIAQALVGRDADDQEGLDRALIALDGTDTFARLGGNAIVAVSMASAHAAAAAAGVPLWRHLVGDASVSLPLPEIQIFGGGAHASRRIDVQDLMVIAIGARDFEQAMDWTAEIYRAARALMDERGALAGVADEGGYWPLFDTNEQALETLVTAVERAGLIPGDQIGLSIDVAASNFGKSGRYRLARDGRELDSDGLCELLLQWIDRFPIVAIEDPLAEDDMAAMAAFTRAAGPRIQVIADDLVVTQAGRIEQAAKAGAGNAALIKPNQVGTLSQARAAIDAARSVGWGTIASARSGETEDVTIAHLAVGWGLPQLKVGSIARSERTAKWNECLRIGERLPSGFELPPSSLFPWGRG